MVTVSDVYDFIDEIAPFDTAMDFDNVGILVGDKGQKIDTVVVSLDITNDVVREAKTLGAQLIVSHHPVIFEGIKSLSPNDAPFNLIQSGMSAICAHTNLDVAKEGVNKCLADALGLTDLEPLSIYKADGINCSLGLVGILSEEMSPADFAKFVKHALNCKGLRYTDVNRKIRKVALCSGSGGDLISNAIDMNADAFVTGEIKHHEILIANASDVCVVDSGHFKSENVIIEPLINMLKSKFPEVNFVKSSCCTDHIKYV